MRSHRWSIRITLAFALGLAGLSCGDETRDLRTYDRRDLSHVSELEPARATTIEADPGFLRKDRVPEVFPKRPLPKLGGRDMFRIFPQAAHPESSQPGGVNSRRPARARR